MAGAPTTTEVVLRFGCGRTGTALFGDLTPGSSKRYVFGASDDNTLFVEFWTPDPTIEYMIFLPDEVSLLERMPNTQRYEGSLFINGDHVIKAITRSGARAAYNLSMTIQ